MKYVVTIGDRTLEVDLDGDSAVVNGQPMRVELERIPGTPEVRVVVDGVATMLAVEGQGDGIWRLIDRGAVHEVAIEDERSRHIRLLAGAGKTTGGSALLKSPMPGLVVRIAVKMGEAVSAGMPLIVLEAMKMENELKATGPGLVSAIHVTPGQAVEKGQVLLDLAAAPAAG